MGLCVGIVIKSVLMRYIPGNPISRIIPYSPSFESVFFVELETVTYVFNEIVETVV